MPWTWGTREQDAFEGLKHAFVTAPVLVMPNFEKQFILETDASGFATGGVLSQYDNEGLLHPVAFRSQGMTSAERNSLPLFEDSRNGDIISKDLLKRFKFTRITRTWNTIAKCMTSRIDKP